jgi:hypothetical protein
VTQGTCGVLETGQAIHTYIHIHIHTRKKVISIQRRRRKTKQKSEAKTNPATKRNAVDRLPVAFFNGEIKSTRNGEMDIDTEFNAAVGAAAHHVVEGVPVVGERDMAALVGDAIAGKDGARALIAGLGDPLTTAADDVTDNIDVCGHAEGVEHGVVAGGMVAVAVDDCNARWLDTDADSDSTGCAQARLNRISYACQEISSNPWAVYNC